MNGQDKTINKRTKKVEISNLPNEEFKVMITNKFGRRMNKHSENLNKSWTRLRTK